MLKIKITKGLLVLTETELMNNLPVELIIKALKRGKYELRCATAEKRDLKKEVKNG